MNILHCPNCGGDIIINANYTLRYTKEMILTDNGFDELSDRISDECFSLPAQSLGSAYCESCRKKWERPFYEIGISNKDGSVNLIELSCDEIKMNHQDRRNYFLDNDIEIIEYIK